MKVIGGHCNLTHRKTTQFITNSPIVAMRLQGWTCGSQTTEGIEWVLQTAMDEQDHLDKRGLCISGEINNISNQQLNEWNARGKHVANECHEPEEYAIDDVTFATVDPARVRAARTEEIEYIRKMNCIHTTTNKRMHSNNWETPHWHPVD